VDEHGLLMRRLRQQDGFSLPEMLTAIAIALIVSLAAFSLIDAVLKRTGATTGRIDATQRGRTAMEAITRELRSQVCLPSGTPSMWSRTGNPTDANSATFFVDFSDGGDPSLAPDLHTITFDPVKKQIVESVYKGAKNPTPAVDLPYNGTPVKKVLLTDVVGLADGTPVFRYYAYDGTVLPSPVSAANLKKLAQVKIAFKALPSRGKSTDPGTVVFQDQIFVRDVDPNVAIPNPVCA
jgi:prepilin-type N-terminal cleavage/methylation domain-containing protein